MRTVHLVLNSKKGATSHPIYKGLLVSCFVGRAMLAYPFMLDTPRLRDSVTP